MALQLGLGCRTVGYTQVHRECNCCGKCGGANNLVRVEPIVLTGATGYTIPSITPTNSNRSGCNYGIGSEFSGALAPPNMGTTYSTGFGPWTKGGDTAGFGVTTNFSGVATALVASVWQIFFDGRPFGSGGRGLGWRLSKLTTYSVSAPISGGWYILTKVSEQFINSDGGTFDNSVGMLPFLDTPPTVRVLLCGTKNSCSGCNDVESFSIAGSIAFSSA